MQGLGATLASTRRWIWSARPTTILLLPTAARYRLMYRQQCPPAVHKCRVLRRGPHDPQRVPGSVSWRGFERGCSDWEEDCTCRVDRAGSMPFPPILADILSTMAARFPSPAAWPIGTYRRHHAEELSYYPIAESATPPTHHQYYLPYTPRPSILPLHD